MVVGVAGGVNSLFGTLAEYFVIFMSNVPVDADPSACAITPCEVTQYVQ
jgi:hypothetical protein